MFRTDTFNQKDLLEVGKFSSPIQKNVSLWSNRYLGIIFLVLDTVIR